MSKTTHIGRNQECPCGSGEKYKKCCMGKIDWVTLNNGPLTDYSRKLTLRGKNITFLRIIMSALQVDKFRPNVEFSEIKRAFSPRVVQSIFESIPKIWPDINDYKSCFTKEYNSITSLYTGTYEPEAIFRAVARHSLYSDKIYLVDPFLHPYTVRDQFNPIEHPEEHRSNAVKFTFLWLSLYDWIDAGIVNFIRDPSDFIPGLQQEVIEIQRKKIEGNQDLKKIFDEEIEEEMKDIGQYDGGMAEHFFLSNSNEWLIEMYRKFPGEKPFSSEEKYLQYIEHRREIHPYYVDRLPGQTAEYLINTSGANYEMAKRICSLTNSHIITDLRSRWKEIEFDRREARIDEQKWSPFAKALQNSDLRILNKIPLHAALQLRKENRLENMRLFFRKVWNSSSNPDEYSEDNAVNLASELKARVNEARTEWSKIDQELLKWFGISGSALVTSGLVGFVPAASASAVGGVTGLIQAHLKRNDYKERYPAGFFLGLK